MSLRPYKYVLKAVPQIIDKDGDVIGEELRLNPVELIGAKQVAEWIEKLPSEIPQIEAQLAAIDGLPPQNPAPRKTVPRTRRPRGTATPRRKR